MAINSPKEISEKDTSEETTETTPQEELSSASELEIPAEVPLQFSRNTAVDAVLVDRLVVVKTSGLLEGARQRFDLDLHAPNGAGGSLLQRRITFTSGDATPTVLNSNLYRTAGTTTITDFDDGQVGQVIFIEAASSITITHNGSIINLSGAANFDMVSGDTLTLAMFSDQVWHELARTLVTVPSFALNANIQEFTTTGTWTRPVGALFVEVHVFGGGGGGGFGLRGTADSTNDGAGGGAGGAYAYKRFVANALSATETITIGAGGAGGDFSLTTDAVSGGLSSFGTNLLVADGGDRGERGQNGGGAGGTGTSGNGDITQLGGDGGAGGNSADGNPGITTATEISPRGGGGGGAVEAQQSGGLGGSFITRYVKAGGIGGVGNGTAGTAGSATDLGFILGGVGGGGGASRFTADVGTGGNGAAGGSPGGGGGGGGCKNDAAAGDGGDGGAGATGAIVVITYF